MAEFRRVHEFCCLDILLVEDSRGHSELLKTILEEAQPRCELYVARGGEEAVDFLRSQGKFANVPLPQLMVIDWGLGGDAVEAILRLMKSDPQFRPIPVVIVGSSAVDHEVLRAYDLHASCWVAVDDGANARTERLRTLIDFWVRTAELPRAERSLQLGAT